MTDPVPLIHGARLDQEAVEPEHGRPHELIDPATGAAWATLTYGGEPEARRAVDSAAAALTPWAQVSGPGRAAVLRAVAAELRTEAVIDEFARLITRETGKRIAEARGEVGLSATFFEWFADTVSGRASQVWSHVPGLRHEVSSRALGVVAVLTPWNFPASIPARKIAPALAAGCTVVFKPSEVAPASGLYLAEIIDRHVPRGTVSTVVGEPAAISDIWLADRRVRGLTFTGSTRVGRILAAATAPRFTRSVLELGGNAPFVVLDDADLDDAVEVLMVAKYRNNGQSCIAANQVWAPARLADDLADRFRRSSEKLVIGDPTDESTTLGPLALASDPERIGVLIDSAGGDTWRTDVALPPAGHFIRPAVSVRPARDSALVTEEIFGPAVSVLGYDSLDEVLESVADGPYGLGGYVVGPQQRATEVARKLDVGIVGVNTGSPNTPQVPFAGLKDSGLGVEGSHLGLEAFLAPQTVAVGQ
ncbi:succinate-semialdehyde dehydrogenase/glutarate-semialdehyde dehydrogenase [Nocardioides albertanoniae]|uniref:Succinate-semialdehyde dehydrogenase/glutarate-semialdehyde dehydrogenase n=1 Tax=Nocardioides albertanoniae TaxID=1175486 RepID=A0A543A1D0_9ACTN|nr:aldehyde dehydrogenase family protein [Nocardioides albertanoniae]TQL66395.1 succinate-semialdehyde dehydrogenase/glutarate-semialdehyde dehydrogenase [Nocardioides albertanoniae]